MPGPSLQDILLSTYEHRSVLTGMSSADVYYLPDLDAYLKIAPSDGLSNLSREKEVLEWLEGKLRVPKVLEFEERDGKQLILLSDHLAAHRDDPATIYDLLERSARALRQVHDLPIDNCPFAQDIDTKLAVALDNIREGFVDESDFDEKNLGRTAEEIYAELVEKKPPAEDLVFTHGDFCLPNYLVLDGELSGFIDFERGGVADRYQDIALFLRSFTFNVEIPVDINEIFCHAYGIDSLDEEKMYYYRLLDEVF
jgi:aminoglycoside phosphotransferase